MPDGRALPCRALARSPPPLVLLPLLIDPPSSCALSCRGSLDQDGSPPGASRSPPHPAAPVLGAVRGGLHRGPAAPALRPGLQVGAGVCGVTAPGRRRGLSGERGTEAAGRQASRSLPQRLASRESCWRCAGRRCCSPPAAASSGTCGRSARSGRCRCAGGPACPWASHCSLARHQCAWAAGTAKIAPPGLGAQATLDRQQPTLQRPKPVQEWTVPQSWFAHFYAIGACWNVLVGALFLATAYSTLGAWGQVGGRGPRSGGGRAGGGRG